MAVKDRIDEYRRRAQEARREAERTESYFVKEGFNKVAKEWDQLAEHLDRHRNLQR